MSLSNGALWSGGQDTCNRELVSELSSVEQECLVLEADVKQSEVQKLVLLTERAASKSAFFFKHRLDRSENTNSESELKTMSKGMGSAMCVQLCHSS